GPVALALLLSAPQLVLFTSAALLAGWLVPALGFLVTTVAASALLVMLAQLIGFISGRRRAPGVVGMGLAVLLGSALLTGLGVGMNMDDELIGTVAIPQVGGVHLLREAFAPAFALPYDAAAALDLRLGFCAFAFVVLAGVTGLAL